MKTKRFTSRLVARATVLLLVTAMGCATTGKRQAGQTTCVFFAKETSYPGQACDPNSSMTLSWDDVSHNATGGVWNEEVTGSLPGGVPPCTVFPAQVVSGTVVPGGAPGSTNLELIQPTWHLCPPPPTPCFVFTGTLSADGKTLQGTMDTIQFVAKGETICTCKRKRWS